MEYTVFGLANSREHAERIITRLQEQGFANREISILMSDRQGREMTTETAETSENRSASTKKLGTEKHTKAPEGGVTGAVTGGVVGGVIGLLAGIGAIAIPGLGAFIAAGPLLGLLSGSAIGGATGLVIGALTGLGVPEYEAKQIEAGLKKGGVLLSVNAASTKEVESAKDIFKKEGAHDISSSVEKVSTKKY